MKVQLEDQSLRLRLSEEELSHLQDGGTVVVQTHLGSNRSLRFDVVLSHAVMPAWEESDDRFRLAIPSVLLQDYVARLPCREGLALPIAIAADISLDIEFSVDVRDSLRQRGPRKRQN